MPFHEINDLKNSFIKALSPESIYLFGSFAEGRQNENSDFDFYIIVHDSENDVLKLTVKAYQSIRHKRKRPVDIIVNTKTTFKSRINYPFSVEGEIANKGILLYEKRGKDLA